INPVSLEKPTGVTDIQPRCGTCEQALREMPNREIFDQELEDFLSNNSKIVYAYSGGLDSTVVLVRLADECRRRGIDLKLFTIETGVKGRVTAENIRSVVSFLHLEQNHRLIDIADQLQTSSTVLGVTGEPVSTLEVYAKCRQEGTLPCGKICNSIMDAKYKEIMRDEGVTVLVTGGDTPKRNSDGRYSLYWEKPSGIIIFRGGYAFALTKRGNKNFILENEVPWIDPNCGGYDTDCLVPGVFFADAFDHQASQDPEAVIERYPIILEYLAERARFGVIDREDALMMLGQVEIASPETYQELATIFGNMKRC
ncbi:hypothetical protein KKB16_03895, partial [Patescibacteria group bacterium]|nr:hypothetical protein [Patescibacteria group bacterium]